MILEGNERGYGSELARHLLNMADNDHVEVHAIEGFAGDDLFDAFAEADAISQATQCQKYLFSLSLNPPVDAAPSINDFEDAIAAVERKLGLVGQPRAVVFHEKNGRRHAHCVWSKIDAGTMRAINLSHYKRKLCDISQELYLQHGWDMPEGFRKAEARDPQNYTRQEAGQASREKRDPRALKAMFRRCWEASDSRAAFAAALKGEGYLLARGDRRGFVAVDADGKIWSLSRWCGVKPKEMRARLGSEENLPSIEEVLAEGILPARKPRQRTNPVLEQRHAKLVARQREERAALLKAQETRRIESLKTRRPSMPKGLMAAFLRVTGKYQILVRACEGTAQKVALLDREEQQELINRHLTERRALQRELPQPNLTHGFGVSVDPRQALVERKDDLSLSRAELLRNPARILAHLSHTKSRFDRTDVLRELAKRIDDPLALRDAADKAMRSPELVRLGEGQRADFTTHDYQSAETILRDATHRLSGASGFGVALHCIRDAMVAQDARMRRAFGGCLSDEQRAALNHVLSDQQMTCVVGLAGAGKSTMLATAMDAWRRQGLTWIIHQPHDLRMAAVA